MDDSIIGIETHKRASLWAIVPVKPFKQAKSRLAKTMSPSARMELAAQLLQRTLETLVKCASLAQVLVVSSDDDALRMARGYGAQALPEKTPSNLNRALTQAAALAASKGATAILILPSDLPILTGNDLDEMVALAATGAARCCVICPDRHEQGTNALFLSPPDAIALAFGEGSFARHSDLAHAAGLALHVAHVAGMMLDLDTPADWKLWHAQGAFFARRSVRRYATQPISAATLERLVTAATWAPSAHNRQPWRFALVVNERSRQALAIAMGERLRADRLADGDAPATIEADVQRSNARIAGAPVVVVACMSIADMDKYPDAKRAHAEETMATQSVAMALQNLLLAAHSEGLGACWMCAPLFCADVVKSALKLADDWQPQALVTLGVPANEGKPASRKSVSAVSRWM